MRDNLKNPPEISQIEDLLRTFQPFPREEFATRMASAPWTNPSTTRKKSIKMSRRLQLAGVAACLVLLIIFGFTPAGRVLANEILHFFKRAAGDTLPLPPDQILEAMPTITPEPTFFPSLMSATQVNQQAVEQPEPTLAPTPELAPEWLQDMDSISAKSVAGFDLLEPSELPADYRLQTIQYDPEQQAVRMQYASPQAGSGEFFSITQGKNLPAIPVGASAHLKTVEARGKQIEMVRGGWFVLNSAEQSTWEEGMEVYTYRWGENGVTISVEFFLNEEFSPAYLHDDERLAILNNLTLCPSGTDQKDYACEVQAAAAAAGFHPWQFPQAPEGGFTFKSTYYKPGLTAIWYASGNGELGVLQSTDNFTAYENSEWFSVPEEAIQKVSVAGQPGEYVNGSFIAKAGEDHATWMPDSGQIRLRWKNGDWWFQIVKWGAPELQPQELADLAATLTGESHEVDAGKQGRVESRRVDDAYLSVDDAAKAYGKNILQPTVLPDGMPFSHARLMGDSLMLFYGDFAADKMRVNGAIMVISQGENQGSFANAYADYPAEAVQDVLVNGQPAKLVSGSLQVSFDQNGQQQGEPVWKQTPFALSLYWEDAGCLMTIGFHAGAESGARISQEDIITIAESMQ
jgi:hypothetical protein